MTSILLERPKQVDEPRPSGEIVSERLGEAASPLIDGVEPKNLFPGEHQAELFKSIGLWFESIKDLVPVGGIEMPISRLRIDGSKVESFAEFMDQLNLPEGVVIPSEVIELFDAILEDSLKDPVLGGLDPTFILERTGSQGTDPGDVEYHLDSKERTYTDSGERVFSPVRSREKYMAYVGRPGTLVVHGKVDPKLTHEEGNEVAIAIESSESTVVSQLLPNSMYKVAIGDLLHGAPIHDDGLMIMASFNRDQV